jgi:signal transduction histidine kinase
LKVDPDLVYIEIAIADNGIGFYESYAESIFTPFYRLHSKDSYEGTGLGLALCKNIVERHNGFIWAQGQEGKGATFTMLFPEKLT